MKWLVALGVLQAVLTVGVATADIVHLKDGSALEGAVKRNGASLTVTDSAGKTTTVPETEIESIEKTGGASGAAATARSRLESLRRSVESLTDVRQIIGRYEGFLKQTSDAGVLADARKDLEAWKERLASGMVKVGDAWVSAEQAQALRQKAGAMVEEARKQMAESRMQEAGKTIDQILLVDPTNMGGLFLKGVICCRKDEQLAARKAFEQVRTLLPDHGATLNNLAVVLSRQKQRAAAMGMYALAMKADPQNQTILDNVAEALNAASADEMKNAAAQRTERLFKEQDLELQKKLARKGKYRWGGAWIGKAEYDEMTAIEKEIQAKLKDLQLEERDMRMRVDQLDSHIGDIINRQRNIRSQYTTTDKDGRITRLPLPDEYYRLGNDMDRMERDKQAIIARIGDMPARRADVQRELPKPKYTGAQNLIVDEAFPLPTPGAAAPAGRSPAAGPDPDAATQPASRTEADGNGAGGEGGAEGAADAGRP